jgi:hypothetical protein
MARKLKIEEGPMTGSAIVYGAAVLEEADGSERRSPRALFQVTVAGDIVSCAMYSRSGEYPLESAPEVNKKEGIIKFSSRGTDYVIRAFQDSDKTWFLRGSKKKTASAEQMEKMFMESIRGRYQ